MKSPFKEFFFSKRNPEKMQSTASKKATPMY